MSIEILKIASKTLMSVGVAEVIGNVARTVLPESPKLVQRVMSLVGAFGISMVITNQTDKLIDETIDNAVTTIGKMNEAQLEETK